MMLPFNWIYSFLLGGIMLFHKRILGSLGFNPARARDKFTFLAVVFFLLMPTIPGAQPSVFYHLIFFLGGVILAIPAGLLSWETYGQKDQRERFIF